MLNFEWFSRKKLQRVKFNEVKRTSCPNYKNSLMQQLASKKMYVTVQLIMIFKQYAKHIKSILNE